jgi:hypothetical protein
MVKHRLATSAVVFLSLIGGSAIASAAETASNTPNGYATQVVAYRNGAHRPFYGNRDSYDYAVPREGYGYGPSYEDRWNPYTWNTGNGYY